MKFQVTAQVDRQLWTNNESWLYKVTEQVTADRTKNWTVFTNQQLVEAQYYEFTGTVGESKDKKVLDANGRDIWRTNFNALECKPMADAEEDRSQEPEYSFNSDIPF